MNLTNHEKLSVALDLIHELYNISICVVKDSESIHTFEQEFHYHKAQTAITTDNMNKILSEHPDEIVYLTDSFMLNYIFLQIEESPIILGPFRSLLLSSNDVRTIFARYRIEDLSIKDFFSYYNSFPVFTEAQAHHIIEAMYHVIGCTEMQHIHKITSAPMNYTNDVSFHTKRQNNLKLLEKRYSYEQRFILDIEKGNARSAIMDLHNMQSDVQYLKQLGTTLESEKIGAAITRTTVRLAAMHANLPIYLIDQLSRTNTLTTLKAKSVDEILQAKETMIREFCAAIQENKNNQYCALVQSLLYYFDHNYYKDVNLDEITAELELSKNHVITIFKKETGSTPMAYLRKVRLRQAAVLLTGTNLSVQDISESVGIPDANYFIKLFKKEYGTTPHLYKKKLS